MSNLDDLKRDYNKKLHRNEKAEEWFSTHTVSECLKQIELFNEVTRDLSLLITKIEGCLGRKMTKIEKLKGFEEVRC